MEIITALDFNDINKAKYTVEKIGHGISYYKVGLELFVSSGPAIINWLKSQNKKVFLDLKFYDIPNTASRVVSVATNFGVDMMNIHVQGGKDMMKKCVSELQNECTKKNITVPLLIGVTLLTSLDEVYLSDFDINCTMENPVENYVLKLAKYAKECGLDGVVSSAKETEIIKKNLGDGFITVTPGIRPKGADITDQKRVVTPKDALQLGSDYIVIGRPITEANEPGQVVNQILREINL